MKKSIFIIPVIAFVLTFVVPLWQARADAPDASINKAELPRMVAILPFQNETEEVELANKARKAFYNHFSSKSYTEIKLPIVDEKAVQLEKSSGKKIYELKPGDVCDAIGCDGLVYGKIIDFKKVYAIVYSQLSVEAEVWMVNAKTGKEVFRIRDSVKYHGGGVPMSPLDAIMTAISTAMNLREIQQIRLISELAYKLNEKIPSPEGIAAEQRPLIKEVLTNAKETPFGKGKIVRAGLEGDKELVATFSIGNFKKGIPMKETKTGIYMGEYLVMPGDNTRDMPVIVSLKKPGGYETEWIDVSGVVTIDTTPPPPAGGLKARGFQDRIEVSWETLKNVPDLKIYKVLRSEQPLSGYKETGSTELNTYEDRTPDKDKTYYYRVIAIDQADNESEPQDAVRASLVGKEPVALAGDLEKDTILSGIYTIEDEFVVPKGLTLTIEQGTRIMFDEAASLIVYGKLIMNGKESPVEFFPSGTEQWSGIIMENGSIAAGGFRIKGAETALYMKETEGLIEGGIITESDTGIFVIGTPAPVIKNLSISQNETGIELQKTDAGIIWNNIFQNKDGVSMRDFSGEIKDNNIFNNGKNIASESLVKIGANYFGSIHVEEMRLENVNVVKAYNLRVPDGKIVDAVLNPYVSMTQEDRRNKLTELAIEAGNYFRQRNYGKASTLFEESLKVNPSADVYYYLALCYQEMKDDDNALKILREGVEKFPKDSTLVKSLGLLLYQKGNEEEAKNVFNELIRLSPEDRQVKFLLERMKNTVNSE
ncbi:MAG: DUF799 family lipoprotein [Proteobacteria bacterium]|nr:DUF799 family lipoprotein [Pseudomonadota bacterium]